MKRFALLLSSLLLTSCATMSETVDDLLDVFATETTAYVREAGRSPRCGSAPKQLSVRLFENQDEVLQWQDHRNLKLLKQSGGNYAYALIEMGAKPSGGYGVLVSRKAALDGDELTLKATILQPDPEAKLKPEKTSPCVLITLPRGEYDEIFVEDQNGEIIAKTKKR